MKLAIRRDLPIRVNGTDLGELRARVNTWGADPANAIDAPCRKIEIVFPERKRLSPQLADDGRRDERLSICEKCEHFGTMIVAACNLMGNCEKIFDAFLCGVAAHPAGCPACTEHEK